MSKCKGKCKNNRCKYVVIKKPSQLKRFVYWLVGKECSPVLYIYKRIFLSTLLVVANMEGIKIRDTHIHVMRGGRLTVKYEGTMCIPKSLTIHEGGNFDTQ